MKPDAIYILIEGPPVAKGRPKFARRGKFVTAYTPEKTRNYEDIIREKAIAAMGIMQPFDQALKLFLGIYVPIPASYSTKKRAAALSGELRPTKRPDYDNFAKCLDALNGIVFLDDSQIVEAQIEKHYAEIPQLEIWLYPIGKLKSKEAAPAEGGEDFPCKLA